MNNNKTSIKVLPNLFPYFDNGNLVSKKFDDIFFSKDNGFNESLYTFFKSIKLEEDLINKNGLVIAETGFGTGLNLLTLMYLKEKLNSRCSIDFLSFEKYPLEKDIVSKAHEKFKNLSKYSKILLSKWPKRWPGIHSFFLDKYNISVQIHYGDIETTLPDLNFFANVWFLDGFSPSKNHKMWSEKLFIEISRLSASKAKLATFSSARIVKERLIKNSFLVKKQKGFSKKREMISAIYKPKINFVSKQYNEIIIIGGGIAGASIAYQLSLQNKKHIVLEKDKIASKASGNPAGIIVPFLTVNDTIASKLSVSCLADTRNLIEGKNFLSHEGVVTLDYPERLNIRNKKLRLMNLPKDLGEYFDYKNLKMISGIDSNLGGIFHESGAVIHPKKYCEFLLQNSEVKQYTNIIKISGRCGEWNIIDQNGNQFFGDHIVLCNGYELLNLTEKLNINLKQMQMTSGQITYLNQSNVFKNLKIALNFGGYITPQINGKNILGASFDRLIDNNVTIKRHKYNLNILPNVLKPLNMNFNNLKGRTSIRLATSDRLPLAGELIPGLSVFSALGSRGLTHASLLSKLVVNNITRRPMILNNRIIESIDPKRILN